MMRATSLLRHFAYRILSPGAVARMRYSAFKTFLDWDRSGHSHMTRLERIYHEEEPVDFCAVRLAYEGLAHALAMMIENLRAMAPFSYGNLARLLQRMDTTLRSELSGQSRSSTSPFILEFDKEPFLDEFLVGGKAASLSRISKDLQLPIPGGFVITSSAFSAFCRLNGLEEKIEKELAALNIESALSLEKTSKSLMACIRSAPLPVALEEAVLEAYRRLLPECLCAVRSSAAGEDQKISFAGQYRTILHVGSEDLLNAYKEVMASKYSPTALYYRIRHGYLDEETPMAVLVLQMVEARASGVMYTQDPLDFERDTVTIYSVPGVGEQLVGGTAAPEVTELSRQEDFQVLKGGAASLDQKSARQLAAIGLRLEEYFGCAQDVEWCKDEGGALYLLQSRPLRVDAMEERACERLVPEVSNSVLLSGGERAASGVAMGRVVLVQSPSGLNHIPQGAVLVAPTTSPHFAQVAGRVKAVVTDVGSIAGHFASVARELGIPTLVNTGNATKVLKAGQIVTVDADRRRVLAGVAEELLAFCQEEKEAPPENPLRKRLRKILDGVSPLNLINPKSPEFSAQNCKTLHDLLRFAHEKAVEEMFSLSGKGKRKFRGAKKLISDIPIVLYVLDLGGGIQESAHRLSSLRAEDVSSSPFCALWKGLSGLENAWSSHVVHFDWGNFDRFSLGDGIVSFDSQLLASFALVSPDYMNANIRFGLHFTILDALITPDARESYVSLRFEGGGAGFEGKHLRAIFLAQVLENHGFQVNLERESVSAIFERATSVDVEEKLDVIGRLLAFTPYLDMTLKDLSEVGRLVTLFSKKPEVPLGERDGDTSTMECRESSPPQTEEGPSTYRPTWITAQLAVGHAPMSYEELRSIKRQGLNAIVNLCDEYPDLDQIEKDYGFDVFYLPVPDDQAPDIEEMDKALAWLDEAIYLEKKVLIHCRLGIGRTGTFLRSYFIRRGFGHELTEERLRRVHSHPTSTSQWRLLKRYGKQSEKLSIREPSLEAERAVDLSSYFEEYEELCRMADDACETGSSPRPACGKDTAECCGSPFLLQFIEAVYLRHWLSRELRREDRKTVTRHAVELSKRAIEGGEYRCSLSIGGKCALYAHRPLRCRIFGMDEIREEEILSEGCSEAFSWGKGKRELDEISKRLFFALSGSFLEGKSLLFPVTRVLSGKYVEEYFALLSEIERLSKP
jgi:pyruvate, water dikinase